MKENEKKTSDQAVELNLEKDGEEIVGGTFKLEPVDDPNAEYHLNADELDYIIGRKGRTARSLRKEVKAATVSTSKT